MELTSNLTGIILALVAAATWGGGDFSGGLASRRSNLFQVLFITSVTGIILLLSCALLWREPFPVFN
ncbi:MAG: EamA family transporter, partial [Anaerolineae bacterium]|nr:EamA family transporter [Anaerolineae bacterium]